MYGQSINITRICESLSEAEEGGILLTSRRPCTLEFIENELSDTDTRGTAGDIHESTSDFVVQMFALKLSENRRHAK